MHKICWSEMTGCSVPFQILEFSYSSCCINKSILLSLFCLLSFLDLSHNIISCDKTFDLCGKWARNKELGSWLACQNLLKTRSDQMWIQALQKIPKRSGSVWMSLLWRTQENPKLAPGQRYQKKCNFKMSLRCQIVIFSWRCEIVLFSWQCQIVPVPNCPRCQIVLGAKLS